MRKPELSSMRWALSAAVEWRRRIIKACEQER